MSIVDQAVVWNKRSVDPWNRLTCCKEPLLTLIEFCQVTFSISHANFESFSNQDLYCGAGKYCGCRRQSFQML